MVMHVLCFSSLWRVAPQNGVILMVWIVIRPLLPLAFGHTARH
jgi:hypothetical protein